MSRKQMVATANNYTISNENIFYNIRDIASNHLYEKTILVPSVCNVNFEKVTDFIVEAQKVFPSLLAYTINGKQRLGHNSFIEAETIKNNKIYFCNMYAEKNRKGFRNINYLHLFSCMLEIRNICFNLKTKQDRNVEIHCPKNALGIHNYSGGRWSTISDMIADCWSGINITIYE